MYTNIVRHCIVGGNSPSDVSLSNAWLTRCAKTAMKTIATAVVIGLFERSNAVVLGGLKSFARVTLTYFLAPNISDFQMIKLSCEAIPINNFTPWLRRTCYVSFYLYITHLFMSNSWPHAHLTHSTRYTHGHCIVKTWRHAHYREAMFVYLSCCLDFFLYHWPSPCVSVGNFTFKCRLDTRNVERKKRWIKPSLFN